MDTHIVWSMDKRNNEMAVVTLQDFLSDLLTDSITVVIIKISFIWFMVRLLVSTIEEIMVTFFITTMVLVHSVLQKIKEVGRGGQ